MSDRFEREYELYMERQLATASRKRRRRLLEPRYLEKRFLQLQWFPAFGNFDHLIAEYEINDFKDGTRFIDYAFIFGWLKIAFELDGHETHVAKATPEYVSDQCQQILQQAIGKWIGIKDMEQVKLEAMEYMILQFLVRRGIEAPLVEIAQRFQVTTKTTAKVLRKLVEKQLVMPARTGSVRIRYYMANPAYTVQDWARFNI